MDNHKLAQTMRRQADGLTKQIEKKLNPAIARQNPTSRRQRIAAGMFNDGQRLGQTQNVLYALADLIQIGKVPTPLRNIETRSDVEEILFYPRKNTGNNFLDGIAQAAHEMALAMSNANQFAAQKRKMELRQKEMTLIGQVPGYFPTPAAVVAQMIQMVGAPLNNLTEWVLDPSAGGGRILDGCKEECPAIKTEGIEINRTLLDLCVDKGHSMIGGDCLTISPARRYGVILMNPPFENEGCSIHIQYAYDNLLADGGVLVGITDSGSFYRKSKKAQAFQDFVADNGRWEPLPADSFKESMTGVNTCIVKLEK